MAFICTGLLLYPQIHSGLYRLQKGYQAVALVSGISGYEYLKDAHAEIYYTPEDKDYAGLIQRSVQLYYPLLSKDYQLKNPPDVKIILYPEAESMLKNTGSQSGASMGIYYGGVLHLLSPRVWLPEHEEAERMEIFLEQGPLVHELSHFFTDVKSKGNYEIWFTEGVALYFEYKYMAFEWRRDLQEAARSVSMKELMGGFEDMDRALAYRKAFDVVKGLVEDRGEQGLLDMMESKAQFTHSSPSES